MDNNNKPLDKKTPVVNHEAHLVVRDFPIFSVVVVRADPGASKKLSASGIKDAQLETNERSSGLEDLQTNINYLW